MNYELMELWDSMKDAKYRGTLEEIQRAIDNNNEDVETTVVKVLEMVCQAVHAEAGTFWTYNKFGDGLIHPRATYGGADLRGVHLLPGEGVAGAVIQNGKPALISDCQADPRWQGKTDAKTGFVTQSMMCVPLAVKEFTFGCIQIINKTDGDLFEEKDLEFECGLADTIGKALASQQLLMDFLNPGYNVLNNTPIHIMGGKVRNVAVLFVGIPSFDDIISLVSNEQAADIIDRYLAFISETIVSRGGRIDKFMQDTVVAIWGLDTCHEHPAVEATRAAYDIMKDFKQVLTGLRDKYDLKFGLSIGIDYGPAFIGYAGTKNHMGNTALGSIVNCASFLKDNAPEGAILITKSVVEKLPGSVSSRKLGKSLRIGKSKTPIDIFELRRM